VRRNRRRSLAARLIWPCLALLLAACAPGITPTLANQPAATVTPVPRSTLPPLWTPSDTPTITLTPTPTATPSRTPTPSVEDICAAFGLLHDFTGKTIYDWGSYIPILVNLERRDVLLRFTATHRLSGEGTGFELPGGQPVIMEFRISALPRPGTYDWTLGLRSETYGDICELTGSFIALRPTPIPPPTSTPTLAGED
jgi:hypothetical protein